MKKLIFAAFILVSAIAVTIAQTTPTRTRSAKTGQYVKKSYGTSHPATTVRESTRKRK